MRRVFVFGFSCVAALIVIMAAFWLFGWADALGLSGHGFAALAIGIVLTAVLGVALMALVFHSSRSGQDEVNFTVRDSHRD